MSIYFIRFEKKQRQHNLVIVTVVKFVVKSEHKLLKIQEYTCGLFDFIYRCFTGSWVFLKTKVLKWLKHDKKNFFCIFHKQFTLTQVKKIFLKFSCS